MITAGEVIKNKREELKKDLNSVSSDTKIQKRYLEYIENNEFEKFDSDIFATGFLKIYSQYLDLDVEKILALYRRSTKTTPTISKKSNIFIKRNSIKVSPKLIGIITLSIFLISVIGYIGYQIYKFQKPPVLTISQPVDEYISNEETIIIRGSTQNSTIVEINGNKIEVNDSGDFESAYTLTQGVNSISVNAWKESNTNQKSNTTLKVIYSPSEVSEIEKEEVKEFLLVLSISQSPSWIKLDVDGENKISQVLQPNTQHEYKIENNFTLVTGRVQNTVLSINDEIIPITSSSQSGIGQLTCSIENSELKCE
jgi:cytoskeletal protein RodZ